MTREAPGTRSACAKVFACDLPPSFPHRHPRSERTVLAALLASIEMLARLGRCLPIEVVADTAGGDGRPAMAAGAWAVLPAWPEEIRRQAAEDACDLLLTLPRAAAVAGSARLLVELAGEGGGREATVGTAPDGVRLRCRLGGGRLEVEAGFADGDPWESMAAAVTETFAGIFRALLSDPTLRPAEAAGTGAAPAAACPADRRARRPGTTPSEAVPG